MRLLKLEVENLNSIYGKHTIDFKKDLQDAPLFLISGPTGAGKSTLLDAISLALFGVTPRLRAEGSQEARADQSPAHALSHGTARGRAVLTFRKSSPGESPVTYRATWDVWRGNRKNPKAHGTIQGPYRWLERLDEATDQWNPLATDYPGEQGRVRDLEAAMTEALEGFSLQDFTRCMLLAQGDFAAFLKASEAERGAILERLTRTEQYQRIGARAARRLREAKEACERAESGLGSLKVMDEAEVEALRQVLLEQESSALSAQQLFTEAQSRLHWLEQTENIVASETLARAALCHAQDNQDAAATDLTRLAAFEESREALTHLEATRVRRATVADLEFRLEELALDASKQGIGLKLLEEEAQRTVEALTTAQKTLADREPELQQARRLRVALTGTQQEAKRAAEKHRDAAKARLKWQAQHDEAEVKLRLHIQTTQDAEAALAAVPWATLAEVLGVLDVRYQAIQDRAAHLEQDRRARNDLASKLPSQEQASLEAANAFILHDGLLETLRSEEAACRRELDAELDGAPEPAETRRRLDTVRDATLRRKLALEALARQIQETSLTETRVQDATTHAKTETERASVAEDLARKSENALTQAEQEETDLQQSLELMRWARDLAKERGKLEEGRPCPLCGAEAHPALVDPDQGVKDQQVQTECERLETELGKAKSRVALTRKAFRNTDATFQRAEAEAGNARQLAQEAQETLLRLRGALGKTAAGIGVQPDGTHVSQALEAAEEEHRSLEVRRKALDESDAALQQAAQNFAEARRKAEELKSRKQQAEAQVQAKRERLEAEDQRLALVEDSLKADRVALVADLVSHHLPEDLGKAVAEAHKRVKRFQQARSTHEEALRLQDMAGRAHKEAVLALESARVEVETRCREDEERRETLIQAEAAVSGCLGGEDPDPIQRVLKEAVGQCDKALQEQRKRLQVARDGLTKAQANRDGTARSLEKEQKALVEAEARLAVLLSPLGDEAVLAARALSSEDVRVLTDRRTELGDARRDAATTLKTLQEQLAYQQERRPEGLDLALGHGPLELQREEALAAQQRHSDEAGRTRAALKDQVEVRLRQAEALENLRTAQMEQSLWTRMNRLIGTNEGEAFRRFAQVLNLRDLLVKANARLERLRPRYRLIPARDDQGIERLAFAVQDAAHAGESRPVGTLSGGETFLVSLSLALALADYRTVRMPIETLLLDEGFGTLDPKTLADVLGTLGTLTSQGTQVGLISHVEALQEKIPARILVEPIGSGRSRVTATFGTVSLTP